MSSTPILSDLDTSFIEIGKIFDGQLIRLNALGPVLRWQCDVHLVEIPPFDSAGNPHEVFASVLIQLIRNREKTTLINFGPLSETVQQERYILYRAVDQVGFSFGYLSLLTGVCIPLTGDVFASGYVGFKGLNQHDAFAKLTKIEGTLDRLIASLTQPSR